MTLQSVIRVCLVMVLVWQIGVHWTLFVRGWAGWERLWKRRRRKGRKRSKKDKKAKPFEGLTRQPVCELCVAEAEEQEEEGEREPPPKIERAQGRRREVDTSNHFCPQKGCRYYGWLDRGNIIANGHPSGAPLVLRPKDVGQWRQLKCVVCGKHFQETKELGLPIGSGIVESACKWLIQQRFKGVGMRWSEDGFNHLLHLRLDWVNGRFDSLFTLAVSPNS